MSASTETVSRRERMAVLARAEGGDLARCWKSLGVDPAFEMIRGPETGLATVRGRISGDGDPFNFGDVTVTRATVRVDSGQVGHAYRLGRDTAAARLCAVIDALAQDPAMAQRIDEAVTGPLGRSLSERDRRRRAETEATRVDFFTMVRGED
ncbi:MAG: phosphonate C-P lyase system protein PhnG [Minwuia sp.]|uniref:phosphonate C-P lyase system protein PhnG n=1 Tax=Minwuia sp. TaxID=2493630 RepID=UPI003A882A9D